MANVIWKSTSSTSGTTAGNWVGGAPADGDTTIWNGTGTTELSTDATFAFDLHLLVYPASAAKIGGLATGTATYMTVDGGSLTMPADVGSASGSGSQRVFVAFGSTAATIKIDVTANTGEEGLPPVCLKGTALTAYITGGYVGFAARAGDVATLALLRLTKGSRSSAYVYLGSGCTVTEADIDEGTVYSVSDQACTTLRIGGGTYEYKGTGAHTTITIDSGTLKYNGSGTITTLTVNGTADFTGNAIGCTVTNCTVRGGGSLKIDNGKPASIVFTNAVQFPEGGTLYIPPGMKATLAAI